MDSELEKGADEAIGSIVEKYNKGGVHTLRSSRTTFVVTAAMSVICIYLHALCSFIFLI